MDETTNEDTLGGPSMRLGATLVVAFLAAMVMDAGPVLSQTVGSTDPDAAQEARPIPPDVPENLEELAARATRATVLLDVRTPSGTRQGSGFLVDAGGRLLTNAHVIQDAEAIRVRLASGDVYDQVSILALDDRRDIGIVQIPGFDLPSMELGNSDSVRIGMPVVLIGSPLGLENTVSTGIVSGRRQEPEGFQLLQLTAPASRGSSGGAVLSHDGRVVGIAASQMRAGQNLNFAVPINYARGLLTNLAGDPIAVLTPNGASSNDAEPMSDEIPASENVNASLRFEAQTFQGYRTESHVRLGEDRESRTRVTYRLIETVGGEASRIERYLEREVTERTGPFDTRQTIQRERSRTIVQAEDLQPLSARGETSYWSGTGWQTESYDLQFDDFRGRGMITDSTGRAVEIDRPLPTGIILRPVRDLAFGLLATDSDSLVGRSVEFTTFDPRTGEIVADRYDVQEETTIEVDGESYESLRVSVASGLSNAVAYFRLDRPRILLREIRGTSTGGAFEEITSLEFFTRP